MLRTSAVMNIVTYVKSRVINATQKLLVIQNRLHKAPTKAPTQIDPADCPKIALGTTQKVGETEKSQVTREIAILKVNAPKMPFSTDCWRKGMLLLVILLVTLLWKYI
jgi:hypothetical protein